MSAADAFILRGFELYPDAALAMWTFQSHLYRNLHEVLDGCHDWGRFERTRRLQNSGGEPASGWRVWVMENGVVAGKKVAAELGYWWSPPTEGRGPLVYAAAWGVPAFDADKAPADMHVFTWSGRGVIAAPMPRDLAAQPLLGSQLRIVVDAIQGLP